MGSEMLKFVVKHEFEEALQRGSKVNMHKLSEAHAHSEKLLKKFKATVNDKAIKIVHEIKK
jgi:hypothetical protein